MVGGKKMVTALLKSEGELGKVVKHQFELVMGEQVSMFLSEE